MTVIPLMSALVLAVALTGCGGDGDGDNTSGAPGSTDTVNTREQDDADQDAVTGTMITIKDFAFQPARLTVSAGQMITVTNEDSATHTITAEDGSFDSGDLKQGETYTFSVGEAGTVPYMRLSHESV